MGGEFVFDTRMGTPQRYKLTPRVADLLTLLERQQSRESVLKQMHSLAPHELDSTLISLIRTGLIAREGEFYISLVLSKEPASIDFIRKNL
jgi:hypothetical protein